MKRPVTTIAALLIGLAGCSAPPAPVAPPAPSSAAAPSTSAAGRPDDVACTDGANTASTVRGIAKVAQDQPVLPAAVALFLLDARQKASGAGLTDPALVTAQAELVAAIDDLDAQGEKGLPPGGNASQDKVKLNVTRILAAVAGVEKACAARKG